MPLASLMFVLLEPVCRALAHASIASSGAHSGEQEYLVEVAMAVRDFSLGNNAAAMPSGDDYRTAITPDAISHLLDVRVVFLALTVLFVAVLIAVVVLVIIAIKRKRSRALAPALIIGGLVPLAASIVLALVVVVDFSAFFTWMHGLFFADGTWTFPYDSLLIRSLPVGFWISCAAVWAGGMALLCIGSIVCGLLLKRRQAAGVEQA